ncbi:MAG TPA: hypothetical protein VNQ77_01135 [Frankiaceae bacterium]|nr:hypothetical protein [Frankiaceae bacterium]
MFEEIAYEHGADLRRAAAVHNRAASRADRTAPRTTQRVARSLRATVLHRPAAPVGCQA